ncbi:MAG: alpha/beta hydrolase [Leptolyngbya sp. IPPAS B-1204]|nr:alpha/beta hydrolase [Elainella sp. C42_A2020_010]RNJ70957.1 MAG: alpha/beta hydrolase [Leptolyngbya sp. IPPAS B-1204]
MRESIRQKLSLTLGGLVVGYLALCLLLRWGQTRLMFFPSTTLKASPDLVGLAYEEVWLPMPEGQVHGWWIPATDQAPVLLYLHGNGSNLGDLVTRAKRFHQLGLSVLLIDYRGYGRSQGPFPSEASVYADAEAAWQYLTQTRQISPDRIVVYGESIGGAVAIELAVRHPDAAAVIVESSFTSMRAMVARSIPEFLLPVDWLLTQQFDSLSKVRSLQVPILLIHGTADTTIPATMSQELFAAAPSPKHLLLIPNANHDNVIQIGGKQYKQTVQQFIVRMTQHLSSITSLWLSLGFVYEI